MRKISSVFYLLSFVLFFSCTEKEPEITGTIEELQSQVAELDKRLEHELEVIGEYQYDYVDLRENMKANDLYEHPELKPMLIDFKKRGVGFVKSTKILLKEQRGKLANAAEEGKKERTIEAIKLYRAQVNEAEAAKPDLDNFVEKLNALYKKVAPAGAGE